MLRILYRWLEEEEELPSPMARMRPPIVPEQPVPIVPEDGLRRLLAVCAGKGFEARRDTAIVMLSSDDFGSSVERTATLHPLWRWEVRLVCAARWGGLDGVQLWFQLVVRLSVL